MVGCAVRRVITSTEQNGGTTIAGTAQSEGDGRNDPKLILSARPFTAFPMPMSFRWVPLGAIPAELSGR